MKKGMLYIMLLLLSIPFGAMAQYGGGNGNGTFFTAINTISLEGNPVGLYSGGNGRGETSGTLNATQLDSTAINLYGGGNGRGETLLVSNTNQLDGTVPGVYGGGNGRGEILMATNTQQLDGTSPGLYGGGDGRGENMAAKNTSQLDSTTISLYGGGNGRGETLKTLNNLQLDGLEASMYLGGNGRGEIVSQTNNTPLPVQLISFGATLIDKEVKVQWQTTHEINSAFFVVEKSLDGTSWQAIGTVKAAGQSTTALSYQLFDMHPVEGLNYYRLKLLDADNRFSYSGIASVRYRLASASLIGVYPNPAQYQFTIVVNGIQNNTRLNVRLINTNGQTVLEKQNLTGTTSTFDVAKLPSGTYYLVTEIGGKATTAKVVKE